MEYHNSKKSNQIFHDGSMTFYTASRFFPADIFNDVSTLYAFVRVADNFVDHIPQLKKEFNAFCYDYKQSIKTNSTKNTIIANFIQLSKAKNFDEQWTLAFLRSMQMDLKPIIYNTYQDLLKYIYGSAEVIGLYMTKILDLPESSQAYAQKLGRAYQLFNFLRDINIDKKLGRVYFALEELKRFHLKSLDYQEVKVNFANFQNFVNFQIDRIIEIINESRQGFNYMPKRYAAVIKTATDGFLWAAQKIKKQPLLIYQKKVQPSRLFLIRSAIKNIIYYKYVHLPIN